MNTNYFSLIVGFLAIGLFSYALITVVDNIGRNNGATSNLLDDSQLNSDVGSLRGNLTVYSEDVNSADSSLSNSSIGQQGQGDQGVILESLRGIPDVIRTSPTGIYKISVGYVKRTLLADQGFTFIITVAGGILALALVVAFIRWFVTGEGGKN